MALKFISVAVAAVLSATVAQATDLPNKKAPPAGPVAKNVSLFDGAYIGGSLGAAMTLGDEATVSGDTLRRAIPGVYAGFNYRMNNQFVFGVEGDLNYLGFEDSESSTLTGGGNAEDYSLCVNSSKKKFKWVLAVDGCVPGFTSVNPETYSGNPRVPTNPALVEGADVTNAASFSIRDLDTLRARAGFLVQNNILIFATAGLGFARAELTTDDNGTISNSSGYHSGFVYGGGLEYAHSKDISFKVDYLHYDLGTIDDTLSSVDLVGHMVRAGVAYHF